jgi:FHS family L-fucose permease-like MFS transporter
MSKPASQSSAISGYALPLALVTSLFFLWGIAHNLNGILIPHLRKALQLSNTQSTLVDTADFLAYFLTAIPAGLLIKRFGYRKSFITGLLVFSLGAFLFVPAANTQTYEIFLTGLFIIGCGLTILETAANPYATKLGSSETATARLNLAQSFNGLATFVAPMLGTMFILSGKEYSAQEMAAMAEPDRIAYLTSEASSVKLPYMLLGGLLLLIAVVFAASKLPEFKEDESDDKGSLSGAWAFPHLRWAVVTQFFYVGAQVCVTSFFVRVAKTGAGVDEKLAGYYLGIYGIIFMIGRFVGTFLMRYFKAPKLLSIYAAVCTLLSVVAIIADGKFVVFALFGLGFFMSIMFPTIFSLGIQNVKEHTKPASSLIVMAIIGGALLPVIMGYIIDRTGDNIQIGYTVPLVCYLFVLYFGMKGHKQTKTT